MSVGRLNGAPLKRGAGSPGVPMVMTNSPSGVHLVIVCAPSSAQNRWPSGDTVMACERLVNVPSAEGAEELTLPTEHDHGVVSVPGQRVHGAIRSHGNTCRLVQRHAVRQLLPGVECLVGKCTAADLDAHVVLPS